MNYIPQPLSYIYEAFIISRENAEKLKRAGVRNSMNGMTKLFIAERQGG